MTVYYKFNFNLHVDKITFDGLHISVGELKRSIMQQQKIGKSNDFELQITNAETKEAYLNDDDLIEKNTTVIVARVPLINKKKNWKELEQNTVHKNKPFISFDKIVASSDLSKLATEEEKLATIMTQSTHDYDSSNFVRTRSMTGPVPSNYRCKRCRKGGHFVKNCPTNSQFLAKRSTGIPSSFMIPAKADQRGALLTSGGEYVVPIIDHEAYKECKKDPPPFVTDENSELADRFIEEIPEELKCSLCDGFLQDAVMIPCCVVSYCDDCIRNYLLESDDHQCPACSQTNVSPDKLVPNRYLRIKVMKYMNSNYFSSQSSCCHNSDTDMNSLKSPYSDENNNKSPSLNKSPEQSPVDKNEQLSNVVINNDDINSDFDQSNSSFREAELQRTQSTQDSKIEMSQNEKSIGSDDEQVKTSNRNETSERQLTEQSKQSSSFSNGDKLQNSGENIFSDKIKPSITNYSGKSDRQNESNSNHHRYNRPRSLIHRCEEPFRRHSSNTIDYSQTSFTQYGPDTYVADSNHCNSQPYHSCSNINYRKHRPNHRTRLMDYDQQSPNSQRFNYGYNQHMPSNQLMNRHQMLAYDKLQYERRDYQNSYDYHMEQINRMSNYDHRDRKFNDKTDLNSRYLSKNINENVRSMYKKFGIDPNTMSLEEQMDVFTRRLDARPVNAKMINEHLVNDLSVRNHKYRSNSRSHVEKIHHRSRSASPKRSRSRARNHSSSRKRSDINRIRTSKDRKRKHDEEKLSSEKKHKKDHRKDHKKEHKSVNKNEKSKKEKNSSSRNSRDKKSSHKSKDKCRDSKK